MEENDRNRKNRIARARAYRLYGQNGTRYLDFWQGEGRAILGHKPKGVSTEMKNIIERGLLGPYETVYPGRLCKAMKALLPGYELIGVYGTRERLLERIKTMTDGIRSWADLPDPALVEVSDTRIALWRPFVDREAWPPLLVPIIPFPLYEAPWLLCALSGLIPREHRKREECGGRPGIPGSSEQEISPLLIAGACRAVYDLVAERRPDPSNDDWGFLEERGFFRKGVYFSFRGEMEVYARIREQMLERGFYLSPSFPPVNIIPGEYSAGELKSFRIALEEAT